MILMILWLWSYDFYDLMILDLMILWSCRARGAPQSTPSLPSRSLAPQILGPQNQAKTNLQQLKKVQKSIFRLKTRLFSNMLYSPRVTMYGQKNTFGVSGNTLNPFWTYQEWFRSILKEMKNLSFLTFFGNQNSLFWLCFRRPGTHEQEFDVISPERRAIFKIRLLEDLDIVLS